MAEHADTMDRLAHSMDGLADSLSRSRYRD